MTKRAWIFAEVLVQKVIVSTALKIQNCINVRSSEYTFMVLYFTSKIFCGLWFVNVYKFFSSHRQVLLMVRI